MYKMVYTMIIIAIVFVLTLGPASIAKALPASNVNTQTSAKPPVYAYYYLWWSNKHWHDKLGPNYPYTASQLPLPAVTDADGCNAVSNYAGNQLLDVPTTLVNQDDAGAIENDILTAKNAGITGFWLNWTGDGTPAQTHTSVTYTRRLAEAFAASARVGNFKNWISYKAASMPSADAIINDLNFVYDHFNSETTWERIDGKPVITFTGSRKYSDADVLKVSTAVRDRIFLVGDETRSTLTPARIALFDGITYYWSSQDPYGNPQSFTQIKEMGDKVHAAGKRWFAPFAPGYNSILLTGGNNCVPRNNGDTLRTLWKGNSASNPDGWGLISWNEIAENTHVQPLQKWGNTYLNVLSELINAASSSPTLFEDVPSSHVYWREIETIYTNGITVGCSISPRRFCPSSYLDRAQIAVFNLKANFGSGYIPPSPPWDRFADNWSPAPAFEAWAEGMYNAGLTGGCASSPIPLYCPWQLASREQAAIFGLRMKYGMGFTPPAATGTIFADMPNTNYWSISWAEKAYADGILPHCGIDPSTGKPLFCPTLLVDRGLASYIIVRAKNMQMR